MKIFLIFAAKYLFILPIVALGFYFFQSVKTSKNNMAIFAVASAMLTFLLGLVASHLYFDPRPFVVGHFTPLIPHVPDNGFPSDHALLVSVLAAVASYWNWKLGTSLWVIVLFVGSARVYAGIHHPADIVGSMAIATVSTIVIASILKNILHKNII